MGGEARVGQKEKRRDEIDIQSPSLRLAQFLHRNKWTRDVYSHPSLEMCWIGGVDRGEV